MPTINNNLHVATLGNGCFWCTEAIFKRLKGVESVVSGYAGGKEPNPTYALVSSRTTDYAEALQITFDPAVISYETLLDVFWVTHDPTTLNRQGYDVGPEYRSVIFYHDEQQKVAAEQSKQHLASSGKFSDPIVTAIEPYTTFYPAESVHQDFYDRNRNSPYCRVVIDPKIQKLYKEFPGQLK